VSKSASANQCQAGGPLPVSISVKAAPQAICETASRSPRMTLSLLPTPADIQEKPAELGLHIGFFHIADDRLSTIIHMDVLHPNELLSAVT
jgi:hypothetical protein